MQCACGSWLKPRPAANERWKRLKPAGRRRTSGRWHWPISDEARTVGPRLWRYKMVQIPPNIEVQEGSTTRGVAATYLERVVEEHAAFGWEFHRVDELGVIVNPGCLTLLFGGKSELSRDFVVTFRCPVAEVNWH